MGWTALVWTGVDWTGRGRTVLHSTLLFFYPTLKCHLLCPALLDSALIYAAPLYLPNPALHRRLLSQFEEFAYTGLRDDTCAALCTTCHDAMSNGRSFCDSGAALVTAGQGSLAGKAWQVRARGGAISVEGHGVARTLHVW